MNKRTNLTVNSMKNLMNKCLLVLFLFMALPLASCGGNDDNDGPGGVVDPDEDPGTEQVEDPNVKAAVGYWKEISPAAYGVGHTYMHVKDDGTAIYFDMTHGEYDQSKILRWNWLFEEGNFKLIWQIGSGGAGKRLFFLFPIEDLLKGDLTFTAEDGSVLRFQKDKDFVANNY